MKKISYIILIILFLASLIVFYRLQLMDLITDKNQSQDMGKVVILKEFNENFYKSNYKAAASAFESDPTSTSATPLQKLEYIWALSNQFSTPEEVGANIEDMSKAFAEGINIARDESLDPETRAKGYIWAVAVRGASYGDVRVLRDVYASSMYDVEFKSIYKRLGINKNGLDNLTVDQQDALLSIFTGYLAGEANNLFPTKFASTRKMNSHITEADYIEKNKVLTGKNLNERKAELYDLAIKESDRFRNIQPNYIDDLPKIKVPYLNGMGIGLFKINTYRDLSEGESFDLYRQGYDLVTKKNNIDDLYNHAVYNLLLQAYSYYNIKNTPKEVSEKIAIQKIKEAMLFIGSEKNDKNASVRSFLKKNILTLNESTSANNSLPMKVIIRITSEKDKDIKAFFDTI